MSKDFLASLVLIVKLSNPCFGVIYRFGKDTAASSRSGKEQKSQRLNCSSAGCK